MSQHFSFSIQDTEIFKQTIEKFEQELISRWDDVSSQWSNLEATWYDQEYDKFAPFYERIAYLYEEVSRDLNSHKGFLQRQIDSSDQLKDLVLHLYGLSQLSFQPDSNSPGKFHKTNKEEHKKRDRKKTKLEQMLEYLELTLEISTLLLPTSQILPCEPLDSSEVVICSRQESSLSKSMTGGDAEENLEEAYLKEEEEKKRKREREIEVGTYVINQPKVSRDYDPPK